MSVIERLEKSKFLQKLAIWTYIEKNKPIVIIHTFMLLVFFLLQKVAFLRYFVDESRTPKILHVACHNLSQIHATKTLSPIRGWKS